jgi:hypothetical protein
MIIGVCGRPLRASDLPQVELTSRKPWRLQREQRPWNRAVVELGLFGRGEIPIAHDIEIDRNLVDYGTPLPLK